MKTIVALDPGGTTGWAMWRERLNDDGKVEGDLWTCGQLGPEEHHHELYAFLEREHTDQLSVVCESFEFRQGAQRANLNLMSKEYIGVAKLFAAERGISPVVFQTAGAAKPFITDQKLKAMGLWFPGKKHAMDAMRHLTFYMINREKRHDLIESWKGLV